MAEAPAVAGSFTHVALMYETDGEYSTSVGGFLRAGLEAGQPVFAAVPPARLTLLKDAFGGDAGRVEWADMTRIGRNPAWIIPRVAAFLARNQGRGVRYVGEPIWPSRTSAELREATRHESLINLAFASADAEILCPYDTGILDPVVVSDARRTHPLLLSDGCLRASHGYAEPFQIPAICRAPLPPSPHEAMPFIYRTDLSAVRALVFKHARDAGLPDARANDLVLAVSEVAANTLRHTKSHGTLTIWHDNDEVVCEAHDRGVITDPLAGRRRPPADADGGHGLWLVHQVCDLVELRSNRAGTTIRMHMALHGPVTLTARNRGPRGAATVAAARAVRVVEHGCGPAEDVRYDFGLG